MNFREYFKLFLEKFENATNFLLDPNNKDKILSELEKEFIQEGGQILGKGIAGKVYSFPTWDYVLKTFNDDHCYIQFVRYASKNSRPAFPKFYGSLQRVIPQYSRHFSQEKLYMIRMEKLNPITENEAGKFRALDKCREIIKNKNLDDNTKSQELQNVFSQYPDLQETVIAYTDLLNKGFFNKCMEDMRHYNIMIRPSTDEFVITDPVYTGNRINPKQRNLSQNFSSPAVQMDQDIAARPHLKDKYKNTYNELVGGGDKINNKMKRKIDNYFTERES